uniref:NADH-ubiquinone oxidoreductase chain 4L n=1 Tax=Paratomella rubra TaxID=90914 RepID=A0A1X9WD89_PARRR|nr:NADH dehydrogenase subunit 4L [Paratomella rubra]ARS00888.1 NADH dehydrogenase subunit 4L [Paratomella rubra]
MLYLLLSFMMLIFGILGFVVNQKYFISVLLVLELFMLSVFFLLLSIHNMSFMYFFNFFNMLIISIVVIEAVLGLILVVNMMRVMGSSNMGILVYKF